MGDSTAVSASELCLVCSARWVGGPGAGVRARVETAAVTRDETGRPVCFAHAPPGFRDEASIVLEMTRFIEWHDEQVAMLDRILAEETRKPLARSRNRALADAHRRAADAIRDALRQRQNRRK